MCIQTALRISFISLIFSARMSLDFCTPYPSENRDAVSSIDKPSV